MASLATASVTWATSSSLTTSPPRLAPFARAAPTRRTTSILVYVYQKVERRVRPAFIVAASKPLGYTRARSHRPSHTIRGPKATMRILSGIQPSGRPHIGNYFGALRQYVTLQEGNEPFYFIASYHALTAVQDGSAPARVHDGSGARLPGARARPGQGGPLRPAGRARGHRTHVDPLLRHPDGPARDGP